MKSSPPVSNIKAMKIARMKQIRAAYLQAKQNGTVSTYHISVPVSNSLKK